MQDDYNDDMEFETRPIYDIVKYTLFKKWEELQMALAFFHKEGAKGIGVYQSHLLILFYAMKPHMIKRYGKIPDSLAWLNLMDTGDNTKLYEDWKKWISAYTILSNELMDMGVLNIHDVKKNPSKSWSRQQN